MFSSPTWPTQCAFLHIQLQLKRLSTTTNSNQTNNKRSSTSQITQSLKDPPLPLVDKCDPATTWTEFWCSNFGHATVRVRGLAYSPLWKRLANYLQGIKFCTSWIPHDFLYSITEKILHNSHSYWANRFIFTVFRIYALYLVKHLYTTIGQIDWFFARRWT